MYASDFEYDGRLLSSFGFIICEFDGSGELNIAETGYDITFNKVTRNRGRKNGLVGTQYDECVQTTFQICKNPDEYENTEITNDEYRELVRWLNRHEFLKFRILSEAAGLDRALCYFNASFNIEKIYVADILYGLALTVETDAPFGYGLPFEKEWNVGANGKITFVDFSDDSGYIRPEITITCKAAGTLRVVNETHDSTMQIKNCSVGEVIHIYGDTQIITSSVANHKIYNDFNYEFLKVGNTFASRRNVISISLPCTFKINYTPVIKDIP